jgi:prepilin-type processing-associated H-X9-DG protein
MVHGSPRRREANVLFADGHVDTFIDDDNTGAFEVDEMEEIAHLWTIKVNRR